MEKDYNLGFKGIDSTFARGTIHPRPFGTGYSLPLDPTKDKSGKN